MATPDPKLNPTNPTPQKLSIASDASGSGYSAAGNAASSAVPNAAANAVPTRTIIPIPSNLDDRDLILREQFSVDDLRLIALWLSGFAGDYRLHGGPDKVEDFVATLTARMREISRIPVTQPGGATVDED